LIALTQDAQTIFRAALQGVAPMTLLEKQPIASLLERPLDQFRRIVVVGAGKASVPMAAAVEAQLGDLIDEGLVVIPEGYGDHTMGGVIEFAEATHPIPNAAGEQAAKRTMEMARGCGADDLLIALISGGGSALWPLFAEGISLEEARATFTALLKSGATIHQFNTLRKHISRISGGRLAAAAAPASCLALIISDVPGDDLSVISSGPTVPDPTTFNDAAEILESFGLPETIPTSVIRHIDRGRKKPELETPKPGDPLFDRVRTALVGCNRNALDAAEAEARRLGYATRIVGDRVEGEANQVGRELVRQALETEAARPTCLIWGGETTVTVRGTGRGGRNQELALGAALALEGSERKMVVLSGGTDGVDGPTDAAGAWATPETTKRSRGLGVSPEEALARNDTYNFFSQAGGLLQTGPTHTNVMDIQIILMT
jgi:glycerate 2-kinase